MFLKSSALAAALGAIPRAALAESTRRRFLFIHAEGGWDPLCVFAPLFGAPSIDLEREAEPMMIRGLSLVDHPGRPSVRTFFERHAERTLIMNGVSVRSVNHETCQAVVLTGSTSDERADWPTLLAHEARSDFDLPSVVFSGPSFAGDHGVLVSRAEGVLQPLLDGRILRELSPESAPLQGPSARIVDRFLARRTAAFTNAHAESPHASDLAEASTRTRRLIGSRHAVDLAPGRDVRGRAQAAVRALASGLCRTASIGTDFVWDTHLNNALQIELFERFFSDLGFIVDLIGGTPGPMGPPLSEDTVIVVLSEMGRTPAYNGTLGRDHWPFTSLMLIGPGFTGARTVGAYTEGFIGVGVDPRTAELDTDRPGISAGEVGATLLALGDVDPKSVLPFAEPITGVLA